MNLKVWILSMAAASVAAQTSGSGSDSGPTVSPDQIKSKPGLCNSSKDCLAGYSCVSVKTKITGLATVKQCVKGTVCSGNVAGSCPTFNSWTDQRYRQVQPVCAFVSVPNCNSAMNAQGQIVQVRRLKENAAKPGNVTCYQATFSSNTSDVPLKVNGIYQCVDRSIYVEENYGYLDLTPKHISACAGNATTSNGVQVQAPLCNAHGTCAPTNSFSGQYKCWCTKGYTENDNCNLATGNTCDAYGQCGAGNCDPNKTGGTCVCRPGYSGFQCSQCDPAYNNNDTVTMCSGQGKCGVDNTCQCNSGYIGSNCELKVKVNSTTSGSSDTVTPAPSSAIREASLALFSIATIAAATLL